MFNQSTYEATSTSKTIFPISAFIMSQGSLRVVNEYSFTFVSRCLEYIDLSHNQIYFISENALNGLVRLQVAVLSYIFNFKVSFSLLCTKVEGNFTAISCCTVINLQTFEIHFWDIPLASIPVFVNFVITVFSIAKSQTTFNWTHSDLLIISQANWLHITKCWWIGIFLAKYAFTSEKMANKSLC